MITILTGAPGHGKSYTLVREIDRAVHRGVPVATNVPLREDWAMVMARRHTFLGWFRKEAVARKATEYERRVLISDDIVSLVKVRIKGTKEGRGLMVLDEAQRELNVYGGRRKEQQVISNYTSGHRHYGLNLLIATQHIDNLDVQVKRVFEYHEQVRNFRRLPILGALLRVNIFLKVRVWNDKKRTKAGIDVYFLSRGLARLYATHALNQEDWPEDAIELPRPKGSAPLRLRKQALQLQEKLQEAGRVAAPAPPRQYAYDGYAHGD